jgi:hypothetical protein
MGLRSKFGWVVAAVRRGFASAVSANAVCVVTRVQSPESVVASSESLSETLESD